MAANDNDVKKISNQFQYNGDGPLDFKQNPVETVAQLPNRLRAYEGQTVTVMSDDEGKTSDYQFTNGKWVKKYQVVDCGEF